MSERVDDRVDERLAVGSLAGVGGKNRRLKLGLYGTGNFEKNRDRESPGPEKPGSGPGPEFLTGTGTGNREKSGIFRNNFLTQINCW